MSAPPSLRSLLAAVVLATAPTVALADAVIGPGQETLLGDMLGQGDVVLAGACRFDRASIDKSEVRASYLCGGKPVELRLRHPDSAPADATRTAKFAILSPLSPPPGLVDALAARIREREGAWKWTIVTGGKPAAQPLANPHRFAPAVLGTAVAAALVSLGVMLLSRRRRRAA